MDTYVTDNSIVKAIGAERAANIRKYNTATAPKGHKNVLTIKPKTVGIRTEFGKGDSNLSEWYLSRTVAELKVLATENGLTYKSKITKPELIDMLVIANNARRKRPADRLTQQQRCDNYRRQNGTNKLTIPQQRRAAKKLRAALGN